MTDVFLLPRAPAWLHNSPVTDLVTVSASDNVLITELLTFVVVFFQIQQSNMIILDDLSSWRFLKLCPGGYCLTHQTLVGGPDSGFPTYTSAPGLP